jgi:5-(carboxyamino)imidazole ribonucleotide synthase
MLSPGSTIGILGGGQLGRMTALAASCFGYRTHVFTAEADSPGAQVTPLVTLAELGDATALRRFARAVDVVTYETENIPLEALDEILPFVPVHPGRRVLEISQDRLREKAWLNRIGIGTAPWRRIGDAADLGRALLEIGPQAILKTTRMGYDGKGQIRLGGGEAPEAAWTALDRDEAILEGFVGFRCEISVIVARGADGALATYPAVENRHVNHILDTTVAPARLDAAVLGTADRIARHIAESLDLVGVLAVEMFVTPDGGILVNELAPRPHNSGHWTIDACRTSQFEQLVRALAGLPLGPTERHADAVMRNLIGDAVHGWQAPLADPGEKLHLYGKREALPGRKMGHVTRLLPLSADPIPAEAAETGPLSAAPPRSGCL